MPAAGPEMIELCATVVVHRAAEHVVAVRLNAHRGQVVHSQIFGMCHQDADDAVRADELLRERYLEEARHKNRHLHSRGHINRSLAARLVVGHEDDGLAGMLQHQRHLCVVGGVRCTIGVFTFSIKSPQCQCKIFLNWINGQGRMFKIT